MITSLHRSSQHAEIPPSTSITVQENPSVEDFLAKAVAMRQRLHDLQDQHEALGGYNAEIHQELLDGGFYKILIPRRYGGYEMSLVDFARIGIEISRGDPGVGWAYILGAGHAFHVASFFGEQAQEELFTQDFIAPGRTVPHGKAVETPGGYRISGTWDYCSGSMWSTHVLVVAPTFKDDVEAPVMKLFVVPRADYSILDDWGGDRTIGMRASSSNSVRIDDVFVPSHLAVDYDFREHVLGSQGTIGYALHRNPTYVGRTMTYFNAELVATQVGAAWAAFDEYDRLMGERPSSFPPRMPRTEAPEYQRWYGQLLGLVDSAETLLLGALGQYESLARRWAETGEEFTPEQDARLRLIVQQSAILAGQAVDIAFSTAGSSSARAGAPMQKYYRDVAMYRTHIAAQWDVTRNSTSRYHFGQPLTF